MLAGKNKTRMAYFYTSCKKLSYPQFLSLHCCVHRLPEFRGYSVVEEAALAANTHLFISGKSNWVEGGHNLVPRYHSSVMQAHLEVLYTSRIFGPEMAQTVCKIQGLNCKLFPCDCSPECWCSWRVKTSTPCSVHCEVTDLMQWCIYHCLF